MIYPVMVVTYGRHPPLRQEETTNPFVHLIKSVYLFTNRLVNNTLNKLLKSAFDDLSREVYKDTVKVDRLTPSRIFLVSVYFSL